MDGIKLRIFGAHNCNHERKLEKQNDGHQKKEKNKMNDETQMDDIGVMMIGLLLIGQSSCTSNQ